MEEMLHRQQEEQQIMLDSVPAWIFFKIKRTDSYESIKLLPG